MGELGQLEPHNHHLRLQATSYHKFILANIIICYVHCNVEWLGEKATDPKSVKIPWRTCKSIFPLNSLIFTFEIFTQVGHPENFKLHCFVVSEIYLTEFYNGIMPWSCNEWHSWKQHPWQKFLLCQEQRKLSFSGFYLVDAGTLRTDYVWRPRNKAVNSTFSSKTNMKLLTMVCDMYLSWCFGCIWNTYVYNINKNEFILYMFCNYSCFFFF